MMETSKMVTGVRLVISILVGIVIILENLANVLLIGVSSDS